MFEAATPAVTDGGAAADAARAMLDLRPDPTDGSSPLEALVELSRSAREDDLEDFLITVADTVCRTAGFTTVVINLYRPAWDDYEVALVIGQPESVDALLGTRTPRRQYARILAEADQPLPGVFMLTGESGFWDDLTEVFVPDLTPRADPNAWRADDGVLVFISDPDGAPLAMFSMDEPVSGLRPNSEELRLIYAICLHAESALQSARWAEAAAENARTLSLLLATSPALLGCTTSEQLFEMASQIVVPKLGFERFAGYVACGDQLELVAAAGWEQPGALPDRLAVDTVDALLVPALEQAGCFLGAAAGLFGAMPDPEAERSRRNGQGATAWRDHCLVVPCRGPEEELRGLVVIEDPLDRLLPSLDRRRALRLLVDQVTAGLVAVDQRDRLRHLATHDPLTGVRNRRGLDEEVGAHAEVAVLVCDLDHFKQVNDRYGHARGDAVLAGFGRLLRELARESDVPMRLGGEEFCVILPQTDRDGALLAAERLRTAASARLAELVPGGLTVSIGIAVSSGGVLDVRRLMSAADQGLYAAKAAGRDRSVLVEAEPS